MNLLSIGQFSKMTRLSVKALRLYDEKGLLPPAHIDPSSRYRYYDREQARQAEIIKILRSIDMPIDRIRAILDATDPVLITKQLVSYRDHLVAHLEAQKRMLAYLETIIERKEIAVPHEIEVDEVPAQHIAVVKIHTTLSRVGSDIQTAFAELAGGLAGANVSPIGAPLLVYHDVIDEETTGEIEVCAPVEATFTGAQAINARTLEGGKMATTTHQGPYEAIGPAYHSLASWIAEHNYEIAGPPREIYLNDPRAVAPTELLTRIEYPVVAHPA